MIRVRKLPNILRNGGVRIEEVIGRKMHASQKADRQLCKGIYWPSGSCHSAQQLVQVALASIYVCISVH